MHSVRCGLQIPMYVPWSVCESVGLNREPYRND